MLLFLVWEKSNFSYKSRLIQKGEHIWSWLQATKDQWKQLVPTELLAGEPFHLPVRRPRWEKGQGCFSLQSTTGAGIHSLSGVYFANRKIYASCFLSFGKLLSCSYDCSIDVCYYTYVSQECLFLPKQASPERRTQLQWVSSSWTPLKTPSAQRTFGCGTAPLA